MQLIKIVGHPNHRERLRDLVRREKLDLEGVMETVRPIIENVKETGDSALLEYTKKFDKADLGKTGIKVSEKEIKNAYSKVDDSLVSAIKHAYKNIGKFHQAQYDRVEKSWSIETDEGVEVGERTEAIDSVGLYVPGGMASYPSTVLMTAVPAKIAGVGRIVVVSPPPIASAILVACSICGVDEVYRVGGAQAIAALAHGTETIKPVSKIVGPGNKYVMAAKNMVHDKVDIDMPAGPSEVLILADAKANPKFIAADLLAQAEHDPDAQSVLVTDSEEIVREVHREIERQLAKLERREIIEKSLDDGTIVITEGLEQSVDVANLYAPEHLEIMTENPEDVASKIRNAGAIFIGEFSAVAAGDYASGGNHVLPTSGSARFASVLNIEDFLKRSTIQKISKKGLKNLQKSIDTLAKAERLDAHANSVDVRLE